MGRITALAFVTPLHHHPQPDTVLRLFEGSRAAWQSEACNVRARRILISGGPNHQLAFGVLAAVRRFALLRHYPALAALVQGNGHRAEAVLLDELTARAVYRSGAELLRLDLTLFANSCLTRRDAELAAECGLSVSVAAAEGSSGAR